RSNRFKMASRWMPRRAENRRNAESCQGKQLEGGLGMTKKIAGLRARLLDSDDRCCTSEPRLFLFAAFLICDFLLRSLLLRCLLRGGRGCRAPSGRSGGCSFFTRRFFFFLGFLDLLDHNSMHANLRQSIRATAVLPAFFLLESLDALAARQNVP